MVLLQAQNRVISLKIGLCWQHCRRARGRRVHDLLVVPRGYDYRGMKEVEECGRWLNAGEGCYISWVGFKIGLKSGEQ